MDTRFWGPPGWELNHNIVKHYRPNSITAPYMKQYFELLPFVLPCKYCRASLTEFIKNRPITNEILLNSDKFQEWLYDIHNDVNNKLRSQGLLKFENPTYDEVQTEISTKPEGNVIPGWDFLYSVAYNMPDIDVCPDVGCEDPTDDNELKTLNIMHSVPPSERIDKMREFMTIIPFVVPSIEAGHKWLQTLDEEDLDNALNQSTETKDPTPIMKWLYNIQSAVGDQKEDFADLMKRIGSKASGCGTNKKGKTCRVSRKKPSSSPSSSTTE